METDLGSKSTPSSSSSTSEAFLAPATDATNASFEVNIASRARSEVKNASEIDSKRIIASEVKLAVSTESKVEDTHVFTCFPKLPLEIRRMIWKEACSVERVLDIWAVTLDVAGTTAFFKKAYGTVPFSYMSHCKHPAVLHTSRESRSVGLENYCLSFGTESKSYVKCIEIKAASPVRIYVNWEFDVVLPMRVPLVEESDLLGYLLLDVVHDDSTSNFPRMQRIAIDSPRKDWIDFHQTGCVGIREIFLYKDDLIHLDSLLDRSAAVSFSFAALE
jgi:hypothetical protein